MISVRQILGGLGISLIWWVVSGSDCSKEDRTYVFAFRDIAVGAQFADGPNANGSHVNIVKEVCRRAGRDCETAIVDTNDCWGEGCSKVLDGRWFDACVLPVTPEQSLGYFTSALPLNQIPNRVVITKPGSNITVANLTDSLNNLTIAHPDVNDNIGCYFANGFFAMDQVAVTSGSLAQRVNTIAQKVLDEEVDIGVVQPFFLVLSVETITDLSCSDLSGSGVSLMARKDDELLVSWWEYEYKKFVCSDDFAPFCNEQQQTFGVDPLCVDGSAVGGC